MNPKLIPGQPVIGSEPAKRSDAFRNILHGLFAHKIILVVAGLVMITGVTSFLVVSSHQASHDKPKTVSVNESKDTTATASGQKATSNPTNQAKPAAAATAPASAPAKKTTAPAAPASSGSGGQTSGGSTGSTTTCPLPKYPDATCTGVPAGTALTAISGDYSIGTDNAVVSGLNVNGCILIEAVGVTVKNSKAKCITTTVNARARNPANPRATIQDSEVDCGNALGSTAIGDLNINVYRVNIHGCENGFDLDSDGTITDSFIHDLFNSVVGDPHTDGLQSAVGSNLLIDHNTFYGFTSGCSYPNDGSCNGTSAINIFNAPTGPTVMNTTVSNNLIAGGAYALYCPRVTTVNFKILNNHFSRIYSPNVGEYGPSADCSGDEIQSGNVIHETGQAITLD